MKNNYTFNNREISSRILNAYPQIRYGIAIKDDNFETSLPIIYAPQAHTDVVYHVRSFNVVDENADALITKAKNIFIGVVTADCVPLLLFDNVINIVGVVHAGWRGIYKDIVKKTIHKMFSLRCKAKNIHVVIGPSIRVCCYAIPEIRAKKFINKYSSLYVKRIDDKYYLDMQRIIIDECIKMNLRQKNIEELNYCTSCLYPRFYSFRRGDKNKKMISYIGRV